MTSTLGDSLFNVMLFILKKTQISKESIACILNRKLLSFFFGVHIINSKHMHLMSVFRNTKLRSKTSFTCLLWIGDIRLFRISAIIHSFYVDMLLVTLYHYTDRHIKKNFLIDTSSRENLPTLWQNRYQTLICILKMAAAYRLAFLLRFWIHFPKIHSLISFFCRL
jgi:hypothetical protein